ncbi:MAG TPA: hypothetical protein VFA26_10825 [Gemmataceae bacterium]|nr:hypothetical protein [Gemmataceae bacterium]
MAGRVLRAVLAGGFLLLGGVALAGEPLPPLPPPPFPPLPYPPHCSPYAGPYARKSAYEVWQYYGVDRHGRWRPRVAYSPYGSYYLGNGAPFPWTITRQWEFMPYVAEP